jgi:PIN domain nuclease of toxin-antitoxin system
VRRLLLDTHVFLWWLENNPRLGSQAVAAIANDSAHVFVSAVTAWEIEIKRALGKLNAPEDLSAAVTAKGFTHLPITFAHGASAGRLPLHHRDPFDRMLIAQAQVEDLEVVSADANFEFYDITRLRADD